MINMKFFTLVLKYSAFFAVLLSFSSQSQSVIVAADQWNLYQPLLKDKKVGLVVNQTSSVNGQHLVDFFLSKKVNVQTIFAPEHGFRGDHDAGATVENNIDARTKLPIISIYGKHKKPSIEVLADLDVILFDIQDVGVRFYTYLSSMHYMMEAAADAGIKFIVLDRPNPNIEFVDGPILEERFKSFVGMHPIPILHGMTLGELALMIKGEGWLNTQKTLDLQVVSIKNYTRNSRYSLPIKPSPNLPNDQAIQLYPSLTFFEPTHVSLGRGTDFPFQVLGHNQHFTGNFNFTPVSMPGAAVKPKLMDQKLTGLDLRQSEVKGLDLRLFIQWYTLFKASDAEFFTSESFMDKLAGTDKLRKMIIDGKTADEISATWQHGVSQFKAQRAPYLLYQ
ncbi:exo-beta-N-acetylmuramidase NamZ family protein [Thalassotalea profundi]|uniref:exo-beta-N-acetylmuramidase NamZ family protein n=1 Tax=Thalassotalea profundi TaxID=2036687 RepID=UPI003570EE8A